MLDLVREFKREENRLRLQSILQTVLIIVFIANAFITSYVLWLRGNIMRMEIESIDSQLNVLLPIEGRIREKTTELNALIAKRKEIESKVSAPRANLEVIRDISLYAPSDFWLTSTSISPTGINFDGYGLSMRGIKNFIQSLLENIPNTSLSRMNIQKVKLDGTECYNFHIEMLRGHSED
ncbi:MAG: hypothetical protein ACP5K2_03845 [bacterium]